MKDSIVEFYRSNNEDARLLKPAGRLEFERLKGLILPQSGTGKDGGHIFSFHIWLVDEQDSKDELKNEKM